ncbi:MAG: hypothetical protein ACI3Z7_06065 [Candidatus Aphodosoma sp.]
MVKRLLLGLSLMLAVTSLSAQTNRRGRNDRMRDREEETEVSEQTTRQPCMRYDDDEYYAASGFMRIKAGGDGERDFAIVATKLLGSLRQQVKQKIGGRYKAVVRDYFDQMDIDDKSTAASHIESAGEQIIDIYLNDTEEDCRQFGPIDEAGYRHLYIGILVRKAELVNQIVDGLEKSNTLPVDLKDQIRANEKAFRESAFRQFEINPDTAQ